MDNIRRQYFIVENDQDNSEVINRWIDHDGQMMKWACKIMDQASREESKKLVPFEKPMFYFFIGDRKLLVSYENTGKFQRYVVNYIEIGSVITEIDNFYQLLNYLYSDKVEFDLNLFIENFDLKCEI